MTLTDFARELLPTPTTQDAANCAGPSQLDRNTPPLNTVVTLLPTPVSNDDHKTPEAHVAAKVRSGAGAVITSLDVMTRQAAVTGEWTNQLLPTPRASEGNGGGVTVTADSICAPLLPTPQARDHKGEPGKNFNTANLVRSINELG